jgi:NAD(P)-dependent dehydrogenase (short-subunit alcohol dehydrogenase family)
MRVRGRSARVLAARAGWAMLVALAAGTAAAAASSRLRALDLRGRSALVTGASRGLGLLLACELARQGCDRVAICARNELELARARPLVEEAGAAVLALPCDVADAAAVARMVAEVTDRFGGVDVLLNNAGIIEVGPARTMLLNDYRQAMDVMFWGTVHCTEAVLPLMRQRGEGRIVNITSIGGKLAVPHLLPYACAKFASVAYSEGLRAELASEGIRITTVVPGLMRTGSFLHARFKGVAPGAEYAMFSVLANAPLTSMDAERAARRIVLAARRGESELILTLPANLAARGHGLFPGTTGDLLGIIARFLPGGKEGDVASVPGEQVQEGLDSRALEVATRWGQDAASRFNQRTPNGSRSRGQS